MSSSVTQKQRKSHKAELIFRDTHFTKKEVEQLLDMFTKLTKTDKISRNTFRDFLHKTFEMTDDTMMDRIFRVFDKDADGGVNMDEWIFGLSIILLGDDQELMEFCFKVYDMNSDGFISREEIFTFHKKSLLRQPIEEDPDEGAKELVELILRLMDDDRDGRLSMTDYCKAVQKDPLLLEALGFCLPDPKKRIAFLVCFQEVPHPKGHLFWYT